MLPRGPKIEFWTCFPEVHGLKFGRASQRSDGMEFGCASQRSIEIEFGRASQRSDGLEGIIHTDVCGPFTLILVK